MANILTGYAETGLTTAFFVRRRRSDGAWWNVSGTPAFEAFDASHITNYGIAATETGLTGIYTATDPADTTEGDYVLMKAATSSLAVADLTTGLRWQDHAGVITTVTNLTNAPTAGDFTATMKTSLNAATPTVTAGTVSDKTGYALTSVYDAAKTAADATTVAGTFNALAAHGDSTWATATGFSTSGQVSALGLPMQASSYVAPDNDTLAELATTLELSAGNYRFTVAALANSPAAGGAVVLASNQPNYAPAKAGDLMGLIDGAITDDKFTVPTEAAGRATKFLSMMRRMWELMENEITRDRATGVVALKNEAGDANLETRTQSTTGTTDTQSQGG